MKQDQYDRHFDLVKLKYLNFENIKSVIITKFESSTSQRRACMTYKSDSQADGNLMPLKTFKHCFHSQQYRD